MWSDRVVTWSIFEINHIQRTVHEVCLKEKPLRLAYHSWSSTCLTVDTVNSQIFTRQCIEAFTFLLNSSSSSFSACLFCSLNSSCCRRVVCKSNRWRILFSIAIWMNVTKQKEEVKHVYCSAVVSLIASTKKAPISHVFTFSLAILCLECTKHLSIIRRLTGSSATEAA